MPLFKIGFGVFLVLLGPFLFGVVCPSKENVMLWGLICELTAWTAVAAEIAKIHQLFHGGRIVEWLLTDSVGDLPNTATENTPQIQPYRPLGRIHGRTSSSGESQIEFELRDVENYLNRAMEQMNEAQTRALRAVDEHLSSRLRRVEVRLKDAVSGDLGWAYFFAILALGGLVLSTVPDYFVCKT